MINKKYLKLLRSKNRLYQNNFIYEVISKRIIDSLDLVNIPFYKILEIGINDNHIFEYLKNKFLKSEITRADISKSFFLKKQIENFISLDLDNWNLKKKYL